MGKNHEKEIAIGHFVINIYTGFKRDLVINCGPIPTNFRFSRLRAETIWPFHSVHLFKFSFKLRLTLYLLSIDEGISGYRDHSLEEVKYHSETSGLELKILSYKQLYNWSMDEIVSVAGRKSNCTFCGVFRRQVNFKYKCLTFLVSNNSSFKYRILSIILTLNLGP